MCRACNNKNNAIFDHLSSCEQLNDFNKMMMYDLPTLDKDEQRFLNINNVSNNTTIINTSNNWNILLIKEAIHIRKEQPILNIGLKTSRDLFLFSFR